MRNRALHDSLRAFALEAARLLRDDQALGAELEFDLEGESPRGGPVLYHYRPLTERFISERWQRLRMLASCPAASEALGSGAAAYLRVNGLRGEESEPALRAMLERLYEDSTDFTFPEERFERTYEEVERTLFEKSVPATVLVPVPGLELRAERAALGDGIELIRGDLTDAPDEAVWGDASDPLAEDERREPNTLLVLTRDVTPDNPAPAHEALGRFRSLLTGLRLWKPGGVALSSLGWRRSGDGRWAPFEIEASGNVRGEPWILVEGEEVELKGFLAALQKSTHGGAVAWALSRFEMGCGRRFEAEALSDYLLGLRALFEAGPEGGARSGNLALSVAVLCAEEDERKRVQRRIELAQALERFVMGDGPDDDYMGAIGADSPRTLVDEVERHLRALLRDVMCGYLAPNLRRLADDLLLDQPPARFGGDAESGDFDSFEIRARALRREQPEPVAAEPVYEPVTSELAALEEEEELEVGVIEAEPPEYDEDPASYSAPV
ncbi:MAG: hypothetical protein WKF32_06525 [Thermoleophilaceae bacterium]